MTLRPDETWHRLLTWTYGQTPSERLAAQILYASGFEDVNPTHPLGGRDGGKDAMCMKDSKTWVMAVYFPHDKKPFKDVYEKFEGDLSGARKNSAFGIAFVTNQELTDGERKQLAACGQRGAAKVEVELFHLERIVALLDTPAMAGVRQQFLYIPAVQSSGTSIDQVLFNDFLAALPQGGETLNLLENQDFGASFPSSPVEALSLINRTWRDATHEFLDDGVEAERKKFMDTLATFLRILSQYAHQGHKQDRMTIGMNDLEDRKEMFELKDKLNGLATAVYTAHQALVRVGRKNLTP